MDTITFSPITSILCNKPAGTIVTGVPGSGKTFFLINIAANSLLMGARVIFIDAKNDGRVLQSIDPSVKIIDINDIEPGAMNPFKILKDVNTNIILSIISCICGDLDDNKLVAVSPIVNDFVNRNKNNLDSVDFLALANYLYASDSIEAQAVGTMLKINEDSKYGKLLFSPGKGDFKLDRQSQVISLFGMEIPSINNKKWNQEEKFSSAIIYLICKMLKDILIEDDPIPTVLIVDEAHILYGNQNIADIIDSFLILGRSLNVATVLASQNVSHFPKDIAQLIANKFMFNMSQIEARQFLDMFDNTDSETGFDRESIINNITNADTGICLMVDNKNRAGFVKIKSNLGGITSNPLLKKRNKKK